MNDNSPFNSREAMGRQHYQPTKKQRTIGLFRRPRSLETSDYSNASPYNSGHPAPSIASAASSCNCNYNTITDTASLASRYGSSSSVSSNSLGPPPVVGLPDYIINIPPIPSLQDDGCHLDRNDNDNGNRTTKLPTIRSFLAIRRYTRPSND